MKTVVAFQCLLTIAVCPELLAQRIREAKVGDIATGVIISEDQRQLRLDASPCNRNQDKIILVVQRPYKKIPLGTVVCNGKRYPRVQVIQSPSDKQR